MAIVARKVLDSSIFKRATLGLRSGGDMLQEQAHL
jgi:hypothetical protein